MNEYQHQDTNVGETERIMSLAGAGLTLLLAMTARPTPTRLPLAIGGSYLLYRGLSGNDPLYEMLNIRRAPDGDGDLYVRRAVTVNKPRYEVYTYWRNFENLPRFMQHLRSVTVLDDRRSHWVTSGPFDRAVEWEAEIVDEKENERIAWHSLPGSSLENAGRVEFRDALDGRGTEVDVRLEYRPPLGAPSVVVARLFGEQPWQQVRDDLRRFKQIVEAGETATIFGQTSGRIDEVMKQRRQLEGEQRRAWAAAALPPV